VDVRRRAAFAGKWHSGRVLVAGVCVLLIGSALALCRVALLGGAVFRLLVVWLETVRRLSQRFKAANMDASCLCGFWDVCRLAFTMIAKHCETTDKVPQGSFARQLSKDVCVFVVWGMRASLLGLIQSSWQLHRVGQVTYQALCTIVLCIRSLHHHVRPCLCRLGLLVDLGACLCRACHMDGSSCYGLQTISVPGCSCCQWHICHLLTLLLYKPSACCTHVPDSGCSFAQQPNYVRLH
jgi:hypothetical protein